MKKNLLLSATACCFSLLMHGYNEPHPFFGKNTELQELRFIEKQMRFEQKQERLEKKKAEENRYLYMMEKHGCEKQKKFVAHKIEEEKKRQALLDQRDNREQLLSFFREKMDEKKRERFLAKMKAVDDERQEKVRQAHEYRLEKKQLIKDRKEKVWQQFYIAKVEKTFPKVATKERRVVKMYSSAIKERHT